MNLMECIILGISNLRRNPLRSALTILGIIVGVGSVVSMVSVGDGSSAMVLREIERTGGTKMIEIYKDDWDKQSGTLSRAAGSAVRGRSRWRRTLPDICFQVSAPLVITVYGYDYIDVC